MAFEDTDDIMNEEEGFDFVKQAMSKVVSGSVDESDDEELEKDKDEETDEEIEGDETEEEIDETAEEIVKKGSQTTEEETDDELTIEDIDDGLVESARKRGWTDERILKYATDDPQVLADIHSLMQFSLKKKEPEETTTKKEASAKKIEYSADQIKQLNEAYGEGYFENVLKPIIDSHNDMAEQVAKTDSVIGQFKEDKTVERNQRDEQIFNEYLDEQSEKFPVLGQWKNVPLLPDGSADINSEMVKERVKLWTTSKAFRDSGLSMQRAVKEAFDWYKGKTQERNVKKQVIKDLNKRKKKFTPRPTNKKVQKKFTTPKEKGLDIIREAIKSVTPSE